MWISFGHAIPSQTRVKAFLSDPKFLPISLSPFLRPRPFSACILPLVPHPRHCPSTHQSGTSSVSPTASSEPDSITIQIYKRPVHPGALRGRGNKALTQDVCLRAAMREKDNGGVEREWFAGFGNKRPICLVVVVEIRSGDVAWYWVWIKVVVRLSMVMVSECERRW